MLTQIQTVNKILEDAYDGPAMYDFWLASKKYEDAPQKKPNEAQDGTKPPVDPSFKSEFAGMKVEDVAEWLKKKPDSVDLDPHHFAVLDRRAEKDGTVVICRIGDERLNGDQLDYLRFGANEASLHLGGMEYGTWEEFRENGMDTAVIEY